MIRTASSIGTAVLICAIPLIVVACEENATPPPQPPAPTVQSNPASPASTTQPAPAPGTAVPQGGGSALGSAKRSANNLADQVDQQQRDLLREMGEEPPPPPGDDD